jgi:UDP-N-acetyl-D-glucosamine/UDP-N-acetyl-D-galactosamine dehydrogenase
LSIKNSQSRVQNQESKIGIIGLGYVGLRLAIEFGKKYQTIGFDINENRISELESGLDKTLEVSKNEFNEAKNLTFTTDLDKIKNCNIYIITVPTPVDKFNTPDLSPLKSASRMVSSVLKKNDIVIYESTVYPGATEEFCVPILEHESGLKYNIDFFCGYSPERINPGDKDHTLTTITKVTSGSNEKTADYVDTLYKSIVPAGTHKASSIAVAEAAKVIENIQRDVNIALINELSMLFTQLGLDTTEVLEAAGSKWNFLPFRPGLVGGHCIGVDPYYLTHKANEIGYNPEMILAGRRINDGMSKFIADTTISEMTKVGINPVGAKVAVFGLTFKENCPDLRNSKVIYLIENLKIYNCKIVVTDSFADQDEAKNMYDVTLTKLDQIKDLDAIVLAVGHNDYKFIKSEHWEKILNKNAVFIDVKSTYSKDYFIDTTINHWRL